MFNNGEKTAYQSVFSIILTSIKLVHLELCGCCPKWWELLTLMLLSSHKLQVLKLNKCKERWLCSIEPIEGHWVKPSSVPEYLLFHLNTVEWKYYNGRREGKKLVAYILKSARSDCIFL